MKNKPFRYELEHHSNTLIEVRYIGYIGEQDVELGLELRRILQAAPTPMGILADVSQLTGFHRSQVAQHGEMYSLSKTKLTGIAVLGANLAVRFGSISVALLSQMSLKNFTVAERAEALAWLASLQPKP